MTNYHLKKEYLSATGLKELKRSPAHFKAWLESEDKETPALRFGKMYHEFVLEPIKFKSNYVVYNTDMRPEKDKTMASNINKAWKKELEQRGELVDQSEYKVLYDMKKVLMNDPKVSQLLTGGEAEKEIFIEDYKGVKVKAKPDYIKDNVIIDLKTAYSSDPNDFTNAAYKRGYHIQAGHYINVALEDDKKQREFVFIAQEKDPPYAVTIHMCSDEFIDVGREEADKLRELYKRCKKLNIWPSYENENEENIFTLELPSYAE